MSKNKEDIGTGMHIEYIGPPKEEEVNPVRTVIEDMFSHELSGSNWRKLSTVELISKVEEKLLAANIPLSERHALLLLRSIKRCKDVESIIFKLNEHLMGSGV